MKTFNDIGICIPEILLPKKDIDMEKWAVIACDQYTSEPEYWERVYELTENTPSAAHIIYPEVYLEESDREKRIENIREKMKEYIKDEIFDTHEGVVYVERTMKNGSVRQGIMLALDLEKYDYNKGSTTLVRATEGTILSRLPPRMAIRDGASIETPHIMVLIDDPDKVIIEPFDTHKSAFKKLYDFDLMLNGGHIAGYAVDDLHTDQVIARLGKLADPEVFRKKYDLTGEYPLLLFAVGDGNHSLATAKAIWEKHKKTYGMDHPSRYALVEIVNVHNKALEFEPIHRVLFGVTSDIHNELQKFFGANYSFEKVSDISDVKKALAKSGPVHKFGIVTPSGWGVGSVLHPNANLPVGTLQAFLDDFIAKKGAEKIDYIHGDRVVEDLGKKDGNVGFYLPAMQKSDLFKTVILDGALPRKTFSMGEADEKRFYLECRKITL